MTHTRGWVFGGSMALVFALEGGAALAVPPTRVIFSGRVGEEAGVFVADVEPAGLGTARLIVPDSNWPAVSPDGETVIVQRIVGGALDLWVYPIDGASGEDGEGRALTTDAAHDYLPAWSPSGEWVVFTSRRKVGEEAEGQPRLWIVRSDGTDEHLLMERALGTSAGATFSPDGRSIVYVRKDVRGWVDVYTRGFDPETGELVGDETRLTEDEATDGAPVFSPDGTRVAWYVYEGQGARLAVANADGTDRLELGGTDWRWYPHWSADGAWLVYSSSETEEGRETDIRAVRVLGDEEGAASVPLFVAPGRQAEGAELR